MSDAADSFVEKTFDEFTEKTEITHVQQFMWGEGNLYIRDYLDEVAISSENLSAFNARFTLRRVKTAELDVLVLDCVVIRADDWFHARDGVIIFNCDQVNQRVEFTEQDTQVEHIGGQLFCFENGRYIISEALLKMICAAQVLKVRIQGATVHSDPPLDWCQGFQKYCRQFYNNVYDASAWPEAVAGGLPPPAKTGCFIATAAMGSYEDGSVRVLRRYRDRVLRRTAAGRRFVRLYYRCSPPVARLIEGSALARGATRVLLVAPLAAWARRRLSANMIEA
ncbi:hypothetical protein I5W21_11990 [Stenotrophomonas maltophilia]|uniref:CFI-box-CTERM domain-containing protein n=1 Tax=Stenotrophomonas geniculata TaxID=86188 RepID=UPI0006BA4D5A|nr:hypothetical protein AN993_06900 [Stenotrophomonas maltophilia]MBA0242333.1 hypothetical protein [Stenotrophomonas maltophilia]MBA0249222.1 hypothetical protein [Stenotrophomonas maltophilia]MBA0306137.1 hypothetical protein [Stenotrophomonas maltophilia]MBA0437766.1 hypothetical protein [Stenotrophomonas maltophilia]